MNQFAPISKFQNAQPLNFEDAVYKRPSIFQQLRQLAAQFGMHYALIHRLGPSQTKLADATYSSIIRDIATTEYTLGDFLGETALKNLSSGNCAVEWERPTKNPSRPNDRFDRYSFNCGVSVPFHNALGNHAALSLCDHSIRNIDLTELTRLALPLISEVLSQERAKNAQSAALSSREADCLQWAAAGKTSLETGIILGLSPHTVNQYLTSATVKLKAVNRTHAVTKAIRMALINLSAV